MKRNITSFLPCLLLVLALGSFLTPALAAGIDPVAISLHPGMSWLKMATDTTKYLPPGSATDTTGIVVGKPYAGFWIFGAADTLGGHATPVADIGVDYRARIKFPGQTTYYWTPWVETGLYIDDVDTLFYTPIWAADSLGWFDDLQFRAVDSGANDSVNVRLWLVKRYRR